MTINFVPNPAADATNFSELFVDDAQTATWYRLWVGNEEGTSGNFVDTSDFNDEARGWIAAEDLDQLLVDYAQADDDVLWVQEYNDTDGKSDWVYGQVDFDAIDAIDRADTMPSGMPLSQMFEDLNVSEGTRYQIWIGDDRGTEGAYLDTPDGKGWLDADDLDSYFFTAEAFKGDETLFNNFGAAGYNEIWIKTEADGQNYGWEHWNVEAVSNTTLTGIDLGGNTVGLAVNTDGGNDTLVGQDGGTLINAADYGDGDGAEVLRVTGDADMRIDLTDPMDQVEELDLNGDGDIAFDGVENDLSNAGVLTVQGFNVFDLYSRNPKNHNDLTSNYFGDLEFDGTGFDGDGVNTDGNIVLSGQGADTIYGGIGNDFIAAGGVVEGQDTVYGGRNADFFFVEVSALDVTDGSFLQIDGGSTFDRWTSQDNDWVLGEFSDDDEPVTINLSEGGPFDWDAIETRSGASVDLADIENFNGSGNLYGFLNDFDAVLGGAGEYEDAHAADGSENSGLGSTAQLIITGSEVDNTIIGGFDNDTIEGQGGDDLLFGGDMAYLKANQNNPNILNIPNDGIDELIGGGGNDNLVFELDGGVYEGGSNIGIDDGGMEGRDTDDQGKALNDEDVTLDAAYDTLWLTEDVAGARTVDYMTEDNTVRLDLAVGKEGGLDNAAGYGGADENYIDEDFNVSYTADQTNYREGMEDNRALVQDIENVNATGLGMIDYQAAGTNDPDLAFANQQNYMQLQGVDLDLRGTYGTAVPVVITEMVGFDVEWEDNWSLAVITYTIGTEPDDAPGFEEADAAPVLQQFEFVTALDGWADEGDFLEDFYDFIGDVDNVNILEVAVDNFENNGNGIEFENQIVDTFWSNTGGNNHLYASDGDDVLEGRTGDDKLMGGLGADKFLFSLDGDDVNVIWRLSDDQADDPTAEGYQIWDGDYERDFNPEPEELPDINYPLQLVLYPAETGVNGININFDGRLITVSSSEIENAIDEGLSQELAAALNNEFAAAGEPLTADVVDGIVTISDTQDPARAFSFDEVDGGKPGWVYDGGVLDPTDADQWEMVIVPPTPDEGPHDELIFVAYEDRLDAERVDDDSFIGSNISLGVDNYAEDLVVGFFGEEVGTHLAEDQRWDIEYTNLTTEDIVTVIVNDVTYTLQVGKDLDGNIIAAEDSNSGATQAGIQAAFLARYADFITSFMDDDTAAGAVDAFTNGNTLILTQRAYNGEETVYMSVEALEVENLSGGEGATVHVFNEAQTEVQLYMFDGRDAQLNQESVLFEGDKEITRSVLESAADEYRDVNQDGIADSVNTLYGLDALVIDGGAAPTSTQDDLVDTIDDEDLLLYTNVEGETPVYHLDQAYTAETIANNTAANSSFLTQNFTVGGDDQLFAGLVDDVIMAGTGDDRVYGNRATDTIDGGKDYWAVQVLGEDQARVFILNSWEADNTDLVLTNDGGPLEDEVIVSVNRIGDTEDGFNFNNDPVYDDTLIFQQSDFLAGQTRFTITLDDYNVTTDGVVELRNDGAGTVQVDYDGNGLIEGDEVDDVTTFTNFENIRTQSGTGRAVADHGQGMDTLNVIELSKDTGGISYNLTNGAEAGEVSYSQNAAINVLAFEAGEEEADEVGATIADVRAAILAEDCTQAFADAINAIDTADMTVAQFLAAVEDLPELLRPTSDSDALINAPFQYSDYESTIIRVDGVENVLAGEGNDLLLIDETEAAKHNTFDADDGVDRIEYRNDFDDVDGSGEPQVTVTVNSATDTDTVTMTGGRVGTDVVANDTLVDVEFISLFVDTAEGILEDDVLDVTAMDDGAVVDLTNGQIRDLDGDVQVTIEEIVELENIWADGDDTVIVADAAVMNTNARSDELNATPSEDIEIATFLDYDEIDPLTDERIAFLDQTSAQITNVINQNQFTYNLSKTGGGDDTDRVDYSAEQGEIISVVDFTEGQTDHFVVVNGNGNDDYTDEESRVDHLIDVEEVVAAGGDNSESIIDLTRMDSDVRLSYQKVSEGTAVSTNIADENTVAVSIFIEDGDRVPFENFSYIEYYDDGLDDDDALGETAYWTRVEGSDADEYIEFTSDQADAVHTLNLRGGDNEVNYNELQSRGIEFSVQELVAGDAGMISVNIQSKNNAGVIENVGDNGAGVDGVANDGVVNGDEVWNNYDRITSYTNQNATAEGSLRVEASQSEDDSINLGSLTSTNLIIVGEQEGTDDIVSVTFGDDPGNDVSVVLTGFEFIRDAQANDIYVITDLNNFLNTLELVDNVMLDSDTLRLEDGALDRNIDFGIDWEDGVIDLVEMEDAQDFDFDVLDISLLTEDTDSVSTDDAGETVVLGDLTLFGDQADAFTDVDGFSAIQFTSDNGMGSSNDVVIDMDLGEFRQDDGTILFTFNAANIFDFSAIENDVNVTVIDTLGVGVTVIGDPEDEFTGDAGDDVFVGGADADVLDGGVTAEVHTLTLTPGADANLGAVVDFSLTFGGTDTISIGEETLAGVDFDTIPAGADIDQLGSAIAALDWSEATFDIDGVGGADEVAGDELFASVTYDAGTNVLSFTYNTGFEDVDDNTLNAMLTTVDVNAIDINGTLTTAGADTAIDETVETAFDAGGADTFMYYSASESTEDAMDTLMNVDANDGILFDSSIIDAVSIHSFGNAMDFTDLPDDTDFFNGDSIAVGSDGTDGYVWVDANDDNDLNEGDMTIFIEGGSDVDDFNQFAVATLGTFFADEIEGIDGDADDDNNADIGEAAVEDVIVSFAGNDKIDITENAILDATDTIVFAANGAANGTDLITGFSSAVGAVDALDFRAFATDDNVTATVDDTVLGQQANADNNIFNVTDADSSIESTADVVALFDNLNAAAGFVFAQATANTNMILAVQGAEDTSIYYIENDADAAIAADEVSLVGVLDGYNTGLVDANIVD